MSRHLFTSDLHLGHAHVADLRGFPDVETHDAAVRASVADAVASRDAAIATGDPVLIGRALDAAWDALAGGPDADALLDVIRQTSEEYGLVMECTVCGHTAPAASGEGLDYWCQGCADDKAHAEEIARIQRHYDLDDGTDFDMARGA